MFKNHLRKLSSSLLFAGLGVATMTMSSCQPSDRTSLRVAGGSSALAEKYNATVYVELTGRNGSGQEHTIRNVGTIVDVGLSSHVALIMSLADGFDKGSIPFFQTAKLKILQYPDLSFDIAIDQSGVTVQKSNTEQPKVKTSLLAVGLRPSTPPPGTVSGLAQRLLRESPIAAEGGRNLRVAETSYVMIGLPKENGAIPAAKLSKMQLTEGNKVVVVGFGETGLADNRDQDKKFNLDGMQARNAAVVTPILGESTPLAKLHPEREHLWEFSGSGLCGSSDGRNYDTGAGVYVDGHFAGFAVRSSTKSSRYKGTLDCKKIFDREDMVTLVVRPHPEDIAAFGQSFSP